MFTYQFKAAQTSISITIRIVDSTDGTPETAVVFNTAGIDIQYRREGAASTAITEVTLAALTTAWTSGGFLHIGNGYYRVDVPDAAFAAGVKGVLIHGTVTGMIVIGAYVHLSTYDPFSANAVDIGSLTAAERTATFTSMLAQSLGTELYAADGAVPTFAQFCFAVISRLFEESIASTTINWKGLNGSTIKMTGTINSATAPTSRTRTT